MKVILFFAFFFFIKLCFGQTDKNGHVSFHSSDLPLIIIQTNGNHLHRDKRIEADLKIISNGSGQRNLLDDSIFSFHGLVQIEIRGSTSQRFPKKSYSFETLNEMKQGAHVSLLGLPSEKDWVLYAPYYDRSLLRDAFAYRISNDMGHYASRTVYAELFLNNEYQGIYILEEKIKCSPSRVPITRISPEDNSGDALTGGYILKIDRPSGNSAIWWMKKMPRIFAKMTASKIFGINKRKQNPGKKTTSKNKELVSAYPPDGSTWQQIEFIGQDPHRSEFTPAQASYIEEFLFVAETSLVRQDTDYRKYFDVSSMVDYFIASEVFRSVDAYRLSTYFYKDRDSKNGKLVMGPLWDFDRSMGNANHCHSCCTAGWAYTFNSDCKSDPWLVPFWWEKLLSDSLFVYQLNERWTGLRKSVLSIGYINNCIDSISSLLKESEPRNFERWKKSRLYRHSVRNHDEEITFLKKWLNDRLLWLDANIPGQNRKINTAKQ